jgi:uncharacterized membrane protein
MDMQPKKNNRASKRMAFALSGLVICAALYILLSTVMLESPLYEGKLAPGAASDTLTAEARIEEKREKEPGELAFDLLILSRTFRGQQISARAKSEYEPLLAAGDRCIVKIILEDSGIKDAVIVSPVRDKTLLILLLLFLFVIILVTGARGLRIIASLVLAFCLLAWVFVPLTLAGISPLLPGMIISLVICTSGILIIGGWNAKSAGAITGALAAFVIAAALPFIACRWLFFTGLDLEFGTYFHLDNFFWFSRDLAPVNFSELLIAGMLISSIGLVMDIAMTISTSVNELRSASGELSRRVLFRSGLNVGTDVLAMMSITVLFVFIGANLELMLLFFKTYRSLPEFAALLNYEDIASEVIRIVSCEIGLVLALPLTALAAALISGRKK